MMSSFLTVLVVALLAPMGLAQEASHDDGDGVVAAGRDLLGYKECHHDDHCHGACNKCGDNYRCYKDKHCCENNDHCGKCEYCKDYKCKEKTNCCKNSHDCPGKCNKCNRHTNECYPKDGCCEDDHDCNDHIDCTKDKCVNYKCEYKPKNYKCRYKNTTCVKYKCDEDDGCVVRKIKKGKHCKYHHYGRYKKGKCNHKGECKPYNYYH